MSSGLPISLHPLGTQPGGLLGGHRATQFGTGGMMAPLEYLKRGMLEPKKGGKKDPLIGYLPGHELGTERLLPVYLDEAMPRLVSSAPGGGKTAGLMTTTALTWLHGLFALDPKGDVYTASAGARTTLMRRKVVLLTTEPCSDHWNPILWVRWDRNDPTGGEAGERDLRILSRFLCEGTAQGNNELLQKIPQSSVLPGLIIHVKTAPLGAPTDSEAFNDIDPRVRERSMAEVRRLLNLPPKPGVALATAMEKSKFNIVRSAGRTLGAMMQGDGKLGRDIKVVLDTTLAPWADRAVRRMTYRPIHNGPKAEPAANTANFADLRGNTDFYVCVHPGEQTDCAPILRTMVGCALDELSRTGASPEAPNVIMAIDEMPMLRRMDIIGSSIAYLRGYKIVPHFYVQDSSQLRHHYKEEWELFEQACTKFFFGIGGIQTAKAVSEYCGTATVDNLGGSYTEGQHKDFTTQNTEGTTTTSGGGSSWQSGPNGSDGGQTNWSDALSRSTTTGTTVGSQTSMTLNYGKVGRLVLMPDEALRLSKHDMIVVARHLRPMRLLNIPYFEFPDLRERAKVPAPRRLSYSDFMNR